MSLITPVIMSGGAGTRLWPLSRAARPKQLHALAGERTLLQQTADRMAAAPKVFGAPVIVCGAGHEAAVRAQFEADDAPALILEPMGRNTAACAAVAAFYVARRSGPQSLVLLAPADHLIASADAFAEAVARGAEAARDGWLVSLGVRPTQPETGYGYIRMGAPCGAIFEAAQFVEKPDRATAERYLAQGGYVWNGGYFLFRADRMTEAMERHAPKIAARAREAVERGRTLADGGVALEEAAFAAAPSDSIDYAVMEKADRIAVSPMDAGWSDVGSWSSVWENSVKDARGNVTVGEVIHLDCEGCLIRSHGPLVAISGVSDLVVVALPDGVLILPKDRSQDVKAVVDTLARTGRRDLL